ncbi:MAG: lipase family protein [Actinomycetota bacterium]|nr:lipase family protein [Actinomycetota bacterium]
MLRRFALLAIAAALLAVPAAEAQVPAPDHDPFYKAPRHLDEVRRGAILRSRPVDLTALGLPLPFRSWQLLYRTNDTHGEPVATVATVILPLDGMAGPRPLLSYQPAEDSLTRNCASSYELRKGDNPELAAMALGLMRGWAVVVSDYEGPDSQWIASLMAAHGVLDGIRAAQRFRRLGLAGRRTPVGLWGYSGGGHATGWATELAASYAPRLRIKGAAFGGAPVDVEATARHLDGGLFAGIELAAAVGLSRAYPEMRVGALLNEAGRAMFREIGDQCIEQFAGGYPFAKLRQFTTVADPLAVPRVERVLDANRLGARAPEIPIYMWHSIIDELNPIGPTDALAATYCRRGVALKYNRTLLGEHVGAVATEAPGAVQYLADRFAGRPAPSTC